MAKRLEIVHTGTAPPLPGPPRKLGVHGTALWKSVHSEYLISDAGGIELLALACQSLDRAESCREQIDKDGELLRLKGSCRSHPLLRDELQNRAFVSRCIARLGLDVEALRSGPGRPGGWQT
jgi:hypothetical protein